MYTFFFYLPQDNLSAKNNPVAVKNPPDDAKRVRGGSKTKKVFGLFSIVM